MRILVVHQYFLGEGDAGGSRWNQFARYWAEKGHRVTVVCGTVHYATGKKNPRYRGRFVVTESIADGIVAKRCHVSQSYNRSFTGRLWAYLSFAVSSTWAGIWAGKHDVMVCTSPPLTVGLTGLMLRLLKRLPMVFEVRDLWPETAIDTGVIKSRLLIRLSYWLERRSYRRASRIVVLTPAFSKRLLEDKGVAPERLSIIPNGADLDIIQPGLRTHEVRERHGLGDRIVVTYVGAHGVANHLVQLLEAARRLQDRGDIVLLLVGDGMEKPKLQSQAEEWGLRNVVFADPVPKHEIGAYLAASDICTAVLKRIDTFKTVYPNKVFDYMSASRPILLAIDGVARELIESAEAGVYVEPECPDAFAGAVRRLADDAELRQRMGENGLRYVREHFDRSMLAGRYERLLNEIVACSETRP